MLPAPWRPTSTRTSTSLRRRVRHAHCLRLHTSCRLRGFAKEAWKRRQRLRAALSLEHLPRCALGLRLCVLSLSRSRSHSRSRSPSLCATYPTVPPHARTRISCPLTSLTLSLFLLPPPLLRLRLRFLLLFVLSSSSLSFFHLLLHLRFFFFVVVFFSIVSASANPCWLKPLWLPAQLLGGVDVGSRTKELSSNVALCCEVVRRWE